MEAVCAIVNFVMFRKRSDFISSLISQYSALVSLKSCCHHQIAVISHKLLKLVIAVTTIVATVKSSLVLIRVYI